MNTRSRITAAVAVLIACLPLSACKTTESAYVAPSPPPAQIAAQHGSTPVYVVDQEYIERVQRQAASRGIGVTWVNKPYKRIPATKDDSASRD